MIDPATVERIKSTANIVEVVGDYVHLIRRGSNYMGLCPFHNERTPSFSVNQRGNFCYCFSCKKGGSPVNFIMEKEGLTYHEALLHLARRYGIEVQERELTSEERARQSAREAMLVANEWAMQKMQEDLTQTEEGRDVGLQYFTHRGVTDEAMKAFRLGYAIDRGTYLTEAAKKAGFDIEVFKKLGLTGVSQQGREYDRFRGRVIFPILNTAGKAIAFGGRDLKGGLAKYVNSPESDLYKKSNELYGIFQAKGTIVSENKCYLVEGYMDVIGMWQSGLRNVVASSGTALTDGQIAMIHRFTDNITLIYDGDAAGIKASLRGIDMLLSHKMNVKVLLLPDGDDPDSFARKHSAEEFRKYVAEHETDIIRYKAQVLLSDISNDPQKRITAVNSVVESIAHIADPVARDIYVQECSSILGVPDVTIAKSVAKARYALVERLKKERERKEINRKYPDNSPNSRASFEGDSVPPDSFFADMQADEEAARKGGHSVLTTIESNLSSESGSEGEKKPVIGRQPDINPLKPLEESVIKYCVRYGYLHFCDFTADDGQQYQMSVVDFVEDDLEVDAITFKTPVYSRIFEILKNARESFDRELEKVTASLNREFGQLRQDGYSEIANGDFNMDQIKQAEKKLEEKLDGEYNSRLLEFIREYPGKLLCSHEDDEVRNTAIELVCEKHQLSAIYQKEGVYESEEDRITVLVPRAITEWKSEMLNLKIKGLIKEFHDISSTGNKEEEKKIQLELSKLLALRSQVAKDIGERILTNGK